MNAAWIINFTATIALLGVSLLSPNNLLRYPCMITLLHYCLICAAKRLSKSKQYMHVLVGGNVILAAFVLTILIRKQFPGVTYYAGSILLIGVVTCIGYRYIMSKSQLRLHADMSVMRAQFSDLLGWCCLLCLLGYYCNMQHDTS